MENHIIIAVVSGVTSLIIIALYNYLRRKNNSVANAFGGVETQLKKRFDLSPNLVAVVKKYAHHEESILTKVAEERALASTSASSNNQKMKHCIFVLSTNQRWRWRHVIVRIMELWFIKT